MTSPIPSMPKVVLTSETAYDKIQDALNNDKRVAFLIDGPRDFESLWEDLLKPLERSIMVEAYIDHYAAIRGVRLHVPSEDDPAQSLSSVPYNLRVYCVRPNTASTNIWDVDRASVRLFFSMAESYEVMLPRPMAGTESRRGRTLPFASTTGGGDIGDATSEDSSSSDEACVMNLPRKTWHGDPRDISAKDLMKTLRMRSKKSRREEGGVSIKVEDESEATAPKIKVEKAEEGAEAAIKLECEKED